MYLYGIDWFNHGYYWEAHEAWEGLWNACGRRGPTGSFLKALIALAAAGLKARGGNPRGVAAHARRAVELFRQAGSRPGSGGSRYMGLDPQALQTWAGEVAARPPVGGEDARGAGSVVFEFVLRPER